VTKGAKLCKHRLGLLFQRYEEDPA
jgi:hypothetical protein